MNAHEDFFDVLLKSRILAAAMDIFGMENLDDDPCAEILPPSVWMFERAERKAILSTLGNLLVHQYVHINTYTNDKTSGDLVQDYVSKVMTLGLLYEEFVDAVRDGDGLRILIWWRYLFLVFKENGRNSYSTETFTILANHTFLLSPRQSQQLVQCRFVNIHGE